MSIPTSVVKPHAYPLIFGFSSTEELDADMPVFHRHGDIEIAFMLEGAGRLRWHDRDIESVPQRISVMWAMMPHRFVLLSRPMRAFVVNVPLPWFLNCELPIRFVTALMRGSYLLDPHPARWKYDTYLFEQWHAEINSGDKTLREIARKDIEVRLRRLAEDLEATGRLEPDNKPNRQKHQNTASYGKVEAMAAYIASHYQEPIKAADVAYSVGLNENYAMQIFRQACGVTLLQYLTQHRLAHAQKLLISTDLKMVQIARAAGFGSDNRFYDIFKRNYGVSPQKYRGSNQNAE